MYDWHLIVHVSMKIMLADRIASDGTPRFAASHQGQFCLSMSHKKDARLIWVTSTPAYLIKKVKTQFSSTLRSIRK